MAEGWDDWGPFYGPMYHQHVGLNSSTVEMCQSVSRCGGRAGARDIQTVVQESTLEFAVPNRDEMLHDMLDMYRRGDEDAPRPACCPPPFDVDNNWMLDYPKAYVIPLGEGQRSDAEANRLVEWLLFNDIEVHRLTKDTVLDGQTFEKGSYVAWLAQPRRGLLDTAMSIGVDISDRINVLYAPPAAWSHGYPWGADVVTAADGDAFSPRTQRIRRPNPLHGGVERSDKGRAPGYTLQIDSPTAVRALNALVSEGVDASLATDAFSGGAAGTALFAGDRATERLLDDVGKDTGLVFRRLGGDAPESEPIEKVPRFRVITDDNGVGTTDQSTWVLRELGFEADPITLEEIDEAPTDPLAGYDLVFNAVVEWPEEDDGQEIAEQRLTSFFAAGGGYVSGQSNGAELLIDSGQAPGLGVSNATGRGFSGILFWENAGGEDSVITGAYPERDTMIADPPTWLASEPGTFTVDARLPESDFFGSGLWPGYQTSGAAGATLIAHGTNVADTARLVVFANNPLYRADPEREWPMVGTAAYWADN